MISQDRLEKAMTYLAETDDSAAVLLSDMERMEFKAKAHKDALITHGEGGLGERTAAAGCHAEYLAHMDVYFHAVRAYNAVKNKRRTEELVVDVWRSIESSRRKAI